MNGKISSGVRWGLVTFLLGVTSGVLGHYLPPIGAIYGVLIISVAFSFAGMVVIGDV